MKDVLFQYTQVDPTTWVYLSSFLMIGLYFKFNRVWSVRNFDLILLILLAPGLLMVLYGQQLSSSEGADVVLVDNTSETEVDDGESTTPEDQENPADSEAPPVGSSPPVAVPSTEADENADDSTTAETELSDPSDTSANGPAVDQAVSEQQARATSIQYAGYVWLFVVGGVLLVRLLIDPTMVRRPMLEPNLTPGGLIFLGCSLFVFVMANVITSEPTTEDLVGPKSAEQLLTWTAADTSDDTLRRHGPGNALLHLFPTIPTMFMTTERASAQDQSIVARRSSKAMAIVAHLMIVIAMVIIGHMHFGNTQMGVGAAALYLLLPYTAQMTGRVDHALPGALMIWAVLFYRRPVVSGLFIGLAAGTIYYPLFLLPLWIGFYWQRGLMRFLIGFAVSIAIMMLSLIFISQDAGHFWLLVRKMFGIMTPVMENMEGIWGLGWHAWYRLPFLVAFVCASIGFAFWPPQKNLGTLLSCAAALMVMVQFWHGYGGGLFMAWYLPLLLLTIFRPNLEDRIALVVLGEDWFSRRFLKPQTGATKRAA